MDNIDYSEICTLLRLNLLLSFSPQSALDAQLFLPELLHVITLLLGCGSMSVKQLVYGLMTNTLHALASTQPSGEVDQQALQVLLERAQGADLSAYFGLRASTVHEAGREGVEGEVLENVEAVATFLGEVLEAGAVSVGEYGCS